MHAINFQSVAVLLGGLNGGTSSTKRRVLFESVVAKPAGVACPKCRAHERHSPFCTAMSLEKYGILMISLSSHEEGVVCHRCRRNLRMSRATPSLLLEFARLLPHRWATAFTGLNVC